MQVVTTLPLVTDDALIEEILGSHRDRLGSWYDGLRNHAYRMLNFGRCLVSVEPHRDERLAIAAAFHDIPPLLDWNDTRPLDVSWLLGYPQRAADLADRYLHEAGCPGWGAQVRLMIENHHKVRPYGGQDAPFVEATRKADWIDVSRGVLRFGIPRDYLRRVDTAFPINELWCRGLKSVLRYAVRHPRRPLPMVRW